VVAAVISHAAPRADAGEPVDRDRVVVVGESKEPPGVLRDTRPKPEHEEIARRVALLIPEGVRLQVGPGPVGDALLRRLTVPVTIDSGLLPDSVVDLASRGLLIGDPVATYLAGGTRLYEWADGRAILHPVEYTHDLGRLSAGPFIAVNTAVEIDFDGQVNVEGTASAVLGGIGGHADYAAAAARSVGGLSVITVTTRHNGKPTLVSRLSRPVSTPSQDVDVIVTERGQADLRGLSRPERHKALTNLWAA
jgi:acyl-CoA hydrolase